MWTSEVDSGDWVIHSAIVHLTPPPQSPVRGPCCLLIQGKVMRSNWTWLSESPGNAPPPLCSMAALYSAPTCSPWSPRESHTIVFSPVQQVLSAQPLRNQYQSKGKKSTVGF